MSESFALHVFDAAIPVGTLEYVPAEDRFAFTYDASWKSNPKSYSISPHIPRQADAQQPIAVRRFLENLLPEGKALDVVTRTYKVSRNNIHGLIHALGQETTGALSFLDDSRPPSPAATVLREISREELRSRISEREYLPFSVWDRRVRLSIAGYQDKLPVYLDADRMYLAEGALASTHILKPEPTDARMPLLVANEHFGMSLAHRLGLPVAPVSILRLPEPVLVVERFDRLRRRKHVRRLHVIDGCQALNLPVGCKYERNFGSGRDVRHIRDGASFELLFSTARVHATQPAVTLRGLVRWALFQFLLGNTDAHGKNVSFFSGPGGLALAPAYDLVCVLQYAGLDHELAMAYGDEFLLENIRPYDWADFAQRTGISRRLLSREMTTMAAAAQSAAAAQASMPDYLGEERGFVEAIARLVEQQAQKLIEMAPAMVKITSLD